VPTVVVVMKQVDLALVVVMVVVSLDVMIKGTPSSTVLPVVLVVTVESEQVEYYFLPP
jgi:hypothetical protein